MIQEERFRTDSKLFRELAEDAYDTCVSAIDALHSLLREHDDDSDHEGEATVAGASSASEHDCCAAHALPAAAEANPFTTLRDRAPQLEAVARRLAAAAEVTAPAPVAAPEVNAYYRRMGYTDRWLQNQQPIWAAYRVSPEAGRQAQLEHGGWATLKNKKRVMIYKGHAFEPPCDRDYAAPGPLKHIGKYNRDTKKVDPLAPGEAAPVVPQTADDYPWWLPRAARA